jgi:hypothetical protein
VSSSMHQGTCYMCAGGSLVATVALRDAYGNPLVNAVPELVSGLMALQQSAPAGGLRRHLLVNDALDSSDSRHRPGYGEYRVASRRLQQSTQASPGVLFAQGAVVDQSAGIYRCVPGPLQLHASLLSSSDDALQATFPLSSDLP